MEIKVQLEKIEAKVAICPICKKEITNMRDGYCQHLLRWDDKYSYFKNVK